MNDISYSRSVLAFVDVLGAGDRASDLSFGSELYKGFEVERRLQAVLGIDAIQSAWFSDNLCISIPIENFSATGQNEITVDGLALAWMGWLVTQVQARLLANNGLALRGAITIGEVCHRPNFVFGPALVRAYQLESKFASFPRVIVDPKLYEGSITPVGTFAPFLTRDGDDDHLFVDFIRVMGDSTGAIRQFDAFRKTIMTELLNARHYHKASISGKWRWLGTYFNSCMNHVGATELLIPADALHVSFAPELTH
jgi:hypothetical protein